MASKKCISKPKHKTQGIGGRSTLGVRQRDYVKYQLLMEEIDPSRKDLACYLKKRIIFYANHYLQINPNDSKAKPLTKLPKSTYYDYLKLLGIPKAQERAREAKKFWNSANKSSRSANLRNQSQYVPVLKAGYAFDANKIEKPSVDAYSSLILDVGMFFNSNGKDGPIHHDPDIYSSCNQDENLTTNSKQDQAISTTMQFGIAFNTNENRFYDVLRESVNPETFPTNEEQLLQGFKTNIILNNSFTESLESDYPYEGYWSDNYTPL